MNRLSYQQKFLSIFFSKSTAVVINVHQTGGREKCEVGSIHFMISDDKFNGVTATSVVVSYPKFEIVQLWKFTGMYVMDIELYHDYSGKSEYDKKHMSWHVRVLSRHPLTITRLFCKSPTVFYCGTSVTGLDNKNTWVEHNVLSVVIKWYELKPFLDFKSTPISSINILISVIIYMASMVSKYIKDLIPMGDWSVKASDISWHPTSSLKSSASMSSGMTTNLSMYIDLGRPKFLPSSPIQ